MLLYHTFAIGQDHPVLRFAAEELRRYMQAVTGVTLTESAHGDVTLTMDHTLDEAYDEFSVCAEERALYIKGANPRSVLYGVYAFCESVLGVRFLHPGFEWIPECKPDRLQPAAFSRKALFQVRAYGMDAAQSMTYGIDMLAKLGYNTYSASAATWREQKEEIRTQLAQRGMMLSLSGHDIGFYVPPEEFFSDHPDWFALRDGMHRPEQPCFSNPDFIQMLAQRVGDYCEAIPELDSLVLMFNDNAFTCECGQCRATGFQASYLHMTEQIQDMLEQRGIRVKLYHIAYNAALAWDMLEGVPQSDKANCMVACWGRNYAFAVPQAEAEQDLRYKRAFDQWGEMLRRSGRDYRVFEYYGDCWMMGTLLPPLGHVIEKDVQYFHSIGVTGIDELEFSIPGELDTMRLITQALYNEPRSVHNEYDTSRQIIWHNHYMLGKCMWENSGTYMQLLADYTAGAYGAAAEAAAVLLQTAERALAPLSRFSTDMFKLRITDAWLRDDFSVKGTHKTCLHCWSVENAYRPVTQDAAESCRLAHDRLMEAAYVLVQTQGLRDALPDGQRKNLTDLLCCFNYFLEKTESLEHQYRAQLCIEDGEFEQAREHLRRALTLESGFDGMEIENCAEWLARLETMEQHENE